MRALAALAAPLLASCSFFAPSTQQVACFSDPDGAEVWIDAERVGVSPITCTLPRGKTVTVTFRRPGFASTSRKLDSELSDAGLTDLIAGNFLLLPLVGLLSNGAWELQPSALTVTMEALPATGAPLPQPR